MPIVVVRQWHFGGRTMVHNRSEVPFPHPLRAGQPYISVTICTIKMYKYLVLW